MAMEQSILKSTKKILNVDPDDDSFDLDILTHINTALSHLQQIGIGPPDGFVIDSDEATWDDFLSGASNSILSAAKTNVYLRVRSVFDPPTLSHVLTAMQQQLTESDMRLSMMREGTEWVDPNAVTVDPDLVT